VNLQFLGCGDAFGSGGRFNTCFLVSGRDIRFLIDCGASSMIAMRRFGVDPNGIDMVLLTHLHGDHFAGLPFMLLDAQLVSRRTKPLTIVGPKTTTKRLTETMECLFPGSTGIEWRFPLMIEEFEEGNAWSKGPVTAMPYRVKHYCGAPPLALRVACGGKTVTYTGDTEWIETLIPAGRDADLFIAEAYYRDKKMKFHLDFETLIAHLDDIRPKRLVLTHMSDDMLVHLGGVAWETAEDGKVIEV
jgi:ribonuclease BN (tRNA processing enzyme)